MLSAVLPETLRHSKISGTFTISTAIRIDHDKYIVIQSSNMSNKYDRKEIFLIGISVAILIGTFAVGSQFVQQSLAQEMGQDVGLNETGNQTANQSAGLGDPSKMTVPSQPVD